MQLAAGQGPRQADPHVPVVEDKAIVGAAGRGRGLPCRHLRRAMVFVMARQAAGHQAVDEAEDSFSIWVSFWLNGVYGASKTLAHSGLPTAVDRPDWLAQGGCKEGDRFFT